MRRLLLFGLVWFALLWATVQSLFWVALSSRPRVLAIPVVIAALPVVFKDTRAFGPVVLLAALGLGYFIGWAGFSVGWFYLPSALATLVAFFAGGRLFLPGREAKRP